MNQNGCITIPETPGQRLAPLRDAVNIGVAAFEELGEEDAHDGAPERGYRSIQGVLHVRSERRLPCGQMAAAPRRSAAPPVRRGPSDEAPSAPAASEARAESKEVAGATATDSQLEAIRKLSQRKFVTSRL